MLKPTLFTIALTALAALVSLMPGCQSLGGACTEIGCGSLYVDYEGPDTDAVRQMRVAIALKDGTMREETTDCQQRSDGSRSCFMEGFELGLGTQEELAELASYTVELINDSDEIAFSEEYQASGQTSRPNGEGCEPVCLDEGVQLQGPL